MAKLNLLPRKEFEIVLDDGKVISGKYGTWAVKRYCDKKGLSLVKLAEKISVDQTFDDLCEVILCAVEYSCRVNKKEFTYTDVDVCEWIDELGGVLGDDYLRLAAHAGSVDEEKKTGSQSNGTSSTELQHQLT